jgi:uncharacterized protein YndB with AHSA1/START domain
MAQPGPGISLQVRRIFQAPREKVFAAWTQREQLERWMGRDVPSHRVSYRELNAKPGGRYVIDVLDTATGAEYVGQGVFREVSPPEKLVFTWGWTKKQSDGRHALLHPETEVTVEFRQQGQATEVILTHTRFEEMKEREETVRGWNGCFDVLAEVLMT